MRRERTKQAAESKRAIGYVRVSTEGQAMDGVSMEAQKARIQAWADASGYELAAVYVDEGLSGKRADNRPGLQDALSHVCRSGGALVVYSLSRLARSTQDAIGIADRLRKARADLVSLTEKIDTTSATGKMVFRLLAVLAEFERDLVSERTRTALAHKRAKHERTGEVPFGWELSPDGIALAPLKAEQDAIAIMLSLRSEGWSLRRIADDLTTRGIATKKGNSRWTHQAVASVLERQAA